MVETTGGFTSAQLSQEAQALVLPSLTQAQAIEIGEIGFAKASERGLPIIVEVRLGEWTVFKVALPGSNPDNDSWVVAKRALLWQLVSQRCMFGWMRKNVALIGMPRLD